MLWRGSDICQRFFHSARRLWTLKTLAWPACISIQHTLGVTRLKLSNTSARLVTPYNYSINCLTGCWDCLSAWGIDFRACWASFSLEMMNMSGWCGRWVHLGNPCVLRMARAITTANMITAKSEPKALPCRKEGLGPAHSEKEEQKENYIDKEMHWWIE